MASKMVVLPAPVSPVTRYRPCFRSEKGTAAERQREKSAEELFAEFYAERSGGEEPAEEDLALLRFAGERLRHRESAGTAEQRDIEALLQFLMRQEAER